MLRPPRFLKKVVHRAGRSPTGWAALRAAFRSLGPPGPDSPMIRVAPPPDSFSADDSVRFDSEGATFELNRSNYFQWARALGVSDEVGTCIRRLLHGEGYFIDVGANIGYYSVLARRWTHRNKPVLAIEPGTVALEMLRRSLELNGYQDVEVEPVALADAEFSAPLHHHASSDIGKASLRSTRSPGGVETVDVTTLDSLWESRGRPAVDLVKVDVEGLEADVLLGAEDLLRSQRPTLIVEVTPDRVDGEKLEQACRLLESLSYVWTAGDLFASGGVGDRDARSLPRALTSQANVVLIPR